MSKNKIPTRLVLQFVLLLQTLFKTADAEIGLSFSPCVIDRDVCSEHAYSLEDVKVMLSLIVERNYRTVITKAVEADLSNEGQCEINTRYQPCSSVKHTALAAAELNAAAIAVGSPFLAVFQGLRFWHDKNKMTSEINAAVDIVARANRQSPGTVQAILFPGYLDGLSLAESNYILSSHILQVRSAFASQNLKLGARIINCEVVPFVSPEPLLWLDHLDFVICLILPEKEDFYQGPEKFFREDALKRFESVQDVFGLLTNNTNLEFILETGWPESDDSDIENTDIDSLLRYWEVVRASNLSQVGRVFMYEAIDNPDIDPINSRSRYGRWRHSSLLNDRSQSAYTLKEVLPEEAPAPAHQRVMPVGLIFGTVAAGVVLLTSIILVIAFISLRRKFSKLPPDEIKNFFEGHKDTTSDDSTEVETDKWKRLPYDKQLELPKSSITVEMDVENLLGAGQFGVVYRGTIQGVPGEVAYKTLRRDQDTPLSALRGILSEIKILSYLGKHDNIVSICGAYTAKLASGIVYLAIEYCPNGSLEKYLRTSRTDYAKITGTGAIGDYVTSIITTLGPESKHSIEQSDMLQWAVDIASAMEYISSKNVIHADLATRNILLTADLSAKVTDFGLSERPYEDKEYIKKTSEDQLPWRWMSVESLKSLKFSTSSDVWSYAVTLWEIYTLGDCPYAGVSRANFLNELENGTRLERPKRTSNVLYDLMRTCWNLEPQDRPSFHDIKTALVHYANNEQYTGKLSNFEKLV